MCARNASAGTSRKLVGAATADTEEKLVSALCCVREYMFADLSLHGNTKWRPLILPGIIVGLLGYAVGNYVGFGVAYVVRGLGVGL